MLPKDNIYDFILTHRLPISRGNSPVKQYLQTYFSDFLMAFNKALVRDNSCSLRQGCYELLNSKVSLLENLCNDIVKTFDYYDTAKMNELSQHFSTMMARVQPFLFEKNIGSVGNEFYRQYYRLRAGTEMFSREQLFHIPMDKRHLIKSYRYSIPGYPCLYLSSGVEMCWFECGMPKEFSYAAFRLEATDDKKIHFIDFTSQPVDLVSSVHIHYLNHPEESTEIDNFIARYIITLPLRIACSLEVINRNVAFIEEYIFPQQLLLWVRDNQVYDGIVYRTCSAVEKAREWNYINLVMSAKEMEDNYCKQLNKMFTITTPVKVVLSDVIKGHSTYIQDVRNFLLYIEPKYYHGYALYPYREIISLCKTFLHLCDMLSNNDYINAEAIYQTMDTLNLLAYLMCDNQSSIKEKALAKSKDLFYGVEEDILVKELDEIFLLFSKKVKPALFEFWSYVSQITGYSSIDNSSYQHIF